MMQFAHRFRHLLAALAFVAWLITPAQVARANMPGTINTLLGSNQDIGTPTSFGSLSSSPFTGPTTTRTFTTSAAIGAGNLAGFCIASNTNTGSLVSAVSDGTNSYTQSTTANDATNTEVTFWYKEGAAAVSSGATVTVTFASSITGTFNGVSVQSVQVGGIISASAQDKVANNFTSGVSTLTATTAALSQTNEIAIGCSLSTTGTVTYSGASGFTNLTSTILVSNGIAVIDTRKVSATTAVAFSPVYSGSNSRVGVTVSTFKGF